MTLTEAISLFEKLKNNYIVTEQAVRSVDSTVSLQVTIPGQNTRLLSVVSTEAQEILQVHLNALSTQINILKQTIKQLVDEDESGVSSYEEYDTFDEESSK